MNVLNKFIIIFVLIGLSSIPLADLFHSGLPVTHDGQDHVARIANFYQNLSEGNVIPRWAGNLNWGYGHPILEFLYPLPSYLASFFYFLGFTLVNSVKLVFGIAFILSGITMYVFVKELLKDEKASLLAGLLYAIAPYRFVDLYVRGAIGEHVAFIFPPLVFYFFLKLSRRYSWLYLVGGAVALAGLNLSHNAISLMFLPLFGLYALFLVLQSKNRIKLVSQYLLSVLLGFGLSAFFWVPAFLEGKYTLRDIVTGGGEYAASFVTWKDFFFGGWSYGGTLELSKQIGLMQWVGIFGSFVTTYFLFRNKNKLWMVSFASLIILVATLFLMTKESNFIWQKISVLQKFQFPWRFLSVAVFLSALLGGISFSLISNKYKKLALLIFIVSLLMVNKDYWYANDFLHRPESFFTGIYNSTTDTGESSPIWSVRFMEKRPKSRIEIVDGQAEIKEIKRTSTRHEYEIKILTEKARILENTLYFPGWTMLVDNKNTNIQFQDPNYRGLITFFVDKGEHNLTLIYGQTKVRKTADTITLLSFISIAVLSLNLIRKKIV